MSFSNPSAQGVWERMGLYGRNGGRVAKAEHLKAADAWIATYGAKAPAPKAQPKAAKAPKAPAPKAPKAPKVSAAERKALAARGLAADGTALEGWRLLAPGLATWIGAEA